MSGARLNNWLLNPAQVGDLADLAAGWKQDTITLRISGMAGFINSPSLLNKIRGALGTVLLESGSPAVRSRQPCNWTPACAAEVFFAPKPSIRIGPFSSEITKPYVLSASSAGSELLIRMRVFGRATDWTRELVPALVQAVQSRVNWRQLAKDGNLFIPRQIEVLDAAIDQINQIILPPRPDRIMMSFSTPLDAERGKLAQNSYLVVERAVRRLFMLGRWQGMKIQTPWSELEVTWQNCRISSATESRLIPRRGGHKFRNAVIQNCEVSLSGDLSAFWPALILGQHCHIGRGASIGLGEYRLIHQA